MMKKKIDNTRDIQRQKFYFCRNFYGVIRRVQIFIWKLYKRVFIHIHIELIHRYFIIYGSSNADNASSKMYKACLPKDWCARTKVHKSWTFIIIIQRACPVGIFSFVVCRFVSPFYLFIFLFSLLLWLFILFFIFSNYYNIYLA